MSKLTIGIPFYNNKTTLGDAISSVLHQTYQDWNLILLDDGSTDGSLEVARKFAHKDQRIRVISDGINRGLIYRLNQIIDLSQGDYIARMDSDDIMMPEKFEKQMNVLNSNSTIDVIGTGIYTIDEKNNPIGVRGVDEFNSFNKKHALKHILFYHPTIIAKANWYKENKYSENFQRAEDFELWCRTFDNSIFYRISEPLLLYREGNVNIKNYVLSMRTMRKIIRQYGPGLLSKPEFFSEIMKTYLKCALYNIFGIFKIQSFLSANRNNKINNYEADKIRRVISIIKASAN